MFEIGAFYKSAVLQAGGRGLFTQNTRSFSDSAHPPRRFAGDIVLLIPPRAARNGSAVPRGAALCSRRSFFLRAKALILSSECGIIKHRTQSRPAPDRFAVRGGTALESIPVFAPGRQKTRRRATAYPYCAAKQNR